MFADSVWEKPLWKRTGITRRLGSRCPVGKSPYHPPFTDRSHIIAKGFLGNSQPIASFFTFHLYIRYTLPTNFHRGPPLDETHLFILLPPSLVPRASSSFILLLISAWCSGTKPHTGLNSNFLCSGGGGRLFLKTVVAGEESN